MTRHAQLVFLVPEARYNLCRGYRAPEKPKLYICIRSNLTQEKTIQPMWDESVMLVVTSSVKNKQCASSLTGFEPWTTIWTQHSLDCHDLAITTLLLHLKVPPKADVQLWQLYRGPKLVAFCGKARDSRDAKTLKRCQNSFCGKRYCLQQMAIDMP